MQILSHRGFWLKNIEKNTTKAFEKSFELEFGTETDLRDFNGEIVISHDIPTSKSHITLDEFFEIYKSKNNNLPLALNVKSDGLQDKIIESITKYNITNYRLFDMSIPDLVQTKYKKLNYLTRVSDLERPVLYEDSCGIWLDSFNSEFEQINIIKSNLYNKKEIWIVSPELHGRDENQFWAELKNIKDTKNYYLCTDKPQKARDIFL